MSWVECAGSVETSSTRRPRVLAESANADEQVVFPTPPLPPKKTTRRSSNAFNMYALRFRGASWFVSLRGFVLFRGFVLTARKLAERRVVHPHPLVPHVELLQQIRIDLEEVQRHWIRQRHGLHEAQECEQIMQVGGLLAELALVWAASDAAHQVRQIVPNRLEVVCPGHLPTTA